MGFRIIKTAVATVIAVYLAMLLKLQFPMSAGLLAILGVESTILKGIATSVIRFSASVLGLVFASLLMMLFGFHLWVIAAYILIIVPVLNRVKLQNGLITCSVVVFHVFSLGEVSLPILFNELLLLLVGLGSATVINMLYMPDMAGELAAARRRVEELFTAIFLQISRHLKDPSAVWSGHEVLEAHDAIREGAALAQKAMENRLLFGDPYWIRYFQMREQQLDIIEDMMNLIAQVYQTLPSGRFVAELFEELSEAVKVEYYTGNVEKHLLELEQQFKNMPMPQSREEFEVRSAILQLCHALKQYLHIAKLEKKPQAIRPHS